MENSNRYEAAVLGDDLPALFAGYILKKNRIRFIFLNAEMVSKNNIGINEQSSYEISKEGEDFVKNLYQTLVSQVIMTEENVSNEESKITADENVKSETALEMNRDMDEGKKQTYLKKFLIWELKNEILNKKTVNHMELKDGRIIAETQGEILDIDVLISKSNILDAGICAQVVMEEKQHHLEEYMKRLRIKPGKNIYRKMVYVTHSKNWFYAKEVVTQFAAEKGVTPINPYMNYAFYMNGLVDRDSVMECCHQLIRNSDELWVFGPVSEAILTDIAVAVMEGKNIRFFSISENISEIHELDMNHIIFEREVHAGQIRKSDLMNFIQSTTQKENDYVQMSLFDENIKW